MTIQALLFDLDGTLFDDRQYVRGGLLHAAEVLASKTGTDLSEELLEAYFRRGVRERAFDVVLSESGLSLDYVSELVDAYHENRTPLVPYLETRAVLERLHEDYRLGVITGGRNGREKLDRLGLADLFDLVIVTAGRDTSKREPAPFEAALDELNTSAQKTAYIGDRPDLDFPLPNQLGMTTVRIRTGQYRRVEATGDARPDVTVPTLQALPDALIEISADE